MQKRKTRLVTLLYLGGLALLMLLGIQPAGATIYVTMDAHELVRRADLIVVGTVEKTATRWEGRQIVTEATVRVQDTVKGAPTSTIRVMQPGGTVDGIAMRVVGGAEFRTGDHAILFLSRAGDALRVVGLAQGKRDVTRDSAGNEVVRWSASAAPASLAHAVEQLRALVRTR